MVAANQSREVDMGVGGRAPARHGNISEDSGGDKNGDKDKVSIRTGRVSQKLVAGGINGSDILQTETMGS